jgi:hypothetical protein
MVAIARSGQTQQFLQQPVNRGRRQKIASPTIPADADSIARRMSSLRAALSTCARRSALSPQESARHVPG